MSVGDLKNFVKAIKSDVELYREFCSLKSECVKNDETELYDLIISFAKEKNFNFDMDDIFDLSFETHSRKENITNDALDDINGGSMKSVLAGSLLASQFFPSVPSASVSAVSLNGNSAGATPYTRSADDTTESFPDALDFLEQNFNLPLIDEEHPFNEVDAMFFSMFSYFPLSLAPTFGDKSVDVTIADFVDFSLAYINDEIDETDVNVNPIEGHTVKQLRKLLSEDDAEGHQKIKLAKLMASNSRYKNIKIGDAYCKFEKKLDVGSLEQFAGVTFTLPDGTKVVTMRGTDNTMVGWKENVDLAWSDNVQAQQHACAYLYGIAGSYPDAAVCVAGHSKGGNLALYSSLIVAESDPTFKERLMSVFNFDGPGIREDILKKYRASYDAIKEKICNYIPQTSIVGVILNNNNTEDRGNYKYVYSNNKYVMQHDALSWRVSPDCMKKGTEKFITPPGDTTDKVSKLFENTLRNTLKRVDYETISLFSSALFKVFGYEDPDAVIFSTTVSEGLKSNQLFYNLKNLTSQEAKAFIEVMEATVSGFLDSLKNISEKSLSPGIAQLMKLVSVLEDNNPRNRKISKIGTIACKFLDILIG